jgi:hypothetical protein
MSPKDRAKRQARPEPPRIDLRRLVAPEPTGQPREEVERPAPPELKRIDIYPLAPVPRGKRTPHEPLGDTLKRAPVVLRVVARIEQWTARDGPRMQRQYGRSIALACRTATAVKHAAMRLEELAAELDGRVCEDSADAGNDATKALGSIGSVTEPRRIGGPMGACCENCLTNLSHGPVHSCGSVTTFASVAVPFAGAMAWLVWGNGASLAHELTSPGQYGVIGALRPEWMIWVALALPTILALIRSGPQVVIAKT